MRFIVAILLALRLQVVATLSLGTHDINAKYTSVRHNVVNQKYQVKSMIPAGYLSRLPRSGRGREDSITIREVVYIPSLLTVSSEDGVQHAEDDEHFLSALVEKGYRVHLLTNNDPYMDHIDALESLVSWLSSKSVPPRTLAIVANELACPLLLRYMTVALQMGPKRADLGALCLIQPPPLQSLSTDTGRRRVLGRYLHLAQEQIAEGAGEEYGVAIHNLLHSTGKTYPASAFATEGGISSEKPSEIDVDEARKKKELGEAKLRAEIEMLEWQSSDEYKGKEAKKMRNLKSKRSKLEKMIYNKQRTVDSSDLISMRLQRLQREPITTAALCGSGGGSSNSPPYLHRAREVGEVMKNRILIVCTDSQEATEVPLVSTMDTNTGEEMTGSSGDMDIAQGEAIFEGMFQDLMLDEADIWGSKACEEVARLYNNEPVICLEEIQDDDDDDDDDEDEDDLVGASHGHFLLQPTTVTSTSSSNIEERGQDRGPLWGEKAERRHAVMAEVLDQWLVQLTTFGYL